MTASDSIPVLDVDRLETDVHALADACEEWGFFHVVRHGIPEDLIAATHAHMRAFFSQPTARKRAIERTADNAWGFFDRELTKNVRDWKQIYDYGPDGQDGAMRNRAQWPANLPAFRPTIEALYHACERLSFRLLAALARSLGTEEDVLRTGFDTHTSFLRLNYYPACDDPAGADAESGTGARFGVNHHTDAGALTVLLQDEQAGLQVRHDGGWSLVEPRSDALVVNIGDIVQVWSNDRYRAPLHRVLASRDKDRYSAPFFFNPSYDTIYRPLVSNCNPERPPRYRPIQWGEFRARRAAGDYADLGEEVQIAHYRIPSLP
jgi:isopenicillin N synthase-like dioxygenase